VTVHRAGQPASPRDAASSTPSEQKINDIEKKYSSNGDPQMKISSGDVEAAIGALDERNGLDVPGRTALFKFLNHYDGNDHSNDHDHNDHFLGADKAALKQAILKGIDSPAALAGQPNQVQAAVLKDLAFNVKNELLKHPEYSLGLSWQGWGHLNFSKVLDSNARNALEGAVKDLNVPDGYSPETVDDSSGIRRVDLGGQPYGYWLNADYDKGGQRNRAWVAILYANAFGKVVSQVSHFVSYD
jgi:hypothetical protein